MELAPRDLDKITAATLQHYDAHAEDFRDGTSDHDVTQNIAALLCHIEGLVMSAALHCAGDEGGQIASFQRGIGQMPVKTS